MSLRTSPQTGVAIPFVPGMPIDRGDCHVGLCPPRNDSGKDRLVQMQKKIPQRQCMGCRERKAKRELIRVVRTPEGTVSLDFGGKMNGRGAYLCPNPECLKKALRSKALDRSLEVTIPEEVYARLEKEMEAGNGQ